MAHGPIGVMAGLVHVLLFLLTKEDVDGRDKRGHDVVRQGMAL
jgi:hypothetical protein